MSSPGRPTRPAVIAPSTTSGRASTSCGTTARQCSARRIREHRPRVPIPMTVFGVHAGLQNTTMRDLIDVWHQAERLGFGWISVWDHFYAADASGSAACFEAVAAPAPPACETTTGTGRRFAYSV